MKPRIKRVYFSPIKAFGWYVENGFGLQHRPEFEAARLFCVRLNAPLKQQLDANNGWPEWFDREAQN